MINDFQDDFIADVDPNDDPKFVHFLVFMPVEFLSAEITCTR